MTKVQYMEMRTTHGEPGAQGQVNPYLSTFDQSAPWQLSKIKAAPPPQCSINFFFIRIKFIRILRLKIAEI